MDCSSILTVNTTLLNSFPYQFHVGESTATDSNVKYDYTQFFHKKISTSANDNHCLNLLECNYWKKKEVDNSCDKTVLPTEGTFILKDGL